MPFDTPVEVVHLAGDLLPRACASRAVVNGQQRRLGLHVMHVGRIVDAGVAHRRAHASGDLLDHRRPADIFGQHLGAHRSADHQPRLTAGPVFALRAKIVACGVITPSQPPDQTIGILAISFSERPP